MRPDLAAANLVYETARSGSSLFLETPTRADWYAETSKSRKGEPPWVLVFGTSCFWAWSWEARG